MSPLTLLCAVLLGLWALNYLALGAVSLYYAWVAPPDAPRDLAFPLVTLAFGAVCATAWLALAQ